MANDTQAPRRPNFLLRQVTLPAWAYAVLMTLSLIVTAHLIVSHPLLASLAFAAYLVFAIAAIVRQRRTRRNSAYAKELHAAPDMRAAVAVVWRRLRTYPVWLLVIVVLASIDVVLGWLGFPSV